MPSIGSLYILGIFPVFSAVFAITEYRHRFNSVNRIILIAETFFYSVMRWQKVSFAETKTESIPNKFPNLF